MELTHRRFQRAGRIVLLLRTYCSLPPQAMASGLLSWTKAVLATRYSFTAMWSRWDCFGCAEPLDMVPNRLFPGICSGSQMWSSAAGNSALCYATDSGQSNSAACMLSVALYSIRKALLNTNSSLCRCRGLLPPGSFLRGVPTLCIYTW